MTAEAYAAAEGLVERSAAAYVAGVPEYPAGVASAMDGAYAAFGPAAHPPRTTAKREEFAAPVANR